MLRADHRLLLVLDGKHTEVEAVNGVFELSNVDRGTHTVGGTRRRPAGQRRDRKQSGHVQPDARRASAPPYQRRTTAESTDSPFDRDRSSHYFSAIAFDRRPARGQRGHAVALSTAL